jgi:kumamolisin
MNPPIKSHGMPVLRGLHALLGLALFFFFVGECQAQVAPLTTQVRQVTLSGQAPYVGNLPATQSMRLVLVLPLRNPAQLNEFLKNLYDPSSASFHQYLSVEEFTAQFGPSEEDYNAVIQFAQANGFSVVGTSRNRLNVDVIGTVQTIENAFHLQLGIYQHPTEDRTFYAPDREPTPSLSVQLWHIAGLDNYSIPHPAGLSRSPDVTSNATTGSGPAASFLGSDMRAAYYGGDLGGSGQSLGLLEYQGTDLSDLATYFANAGQTNNVPITLESTDGTPTSCLNSEGCDDTEQTLDMTQALGMAPGLSSLVVYVGSSDAAIFNAMATAAPLNNQLSSSWTWNPADPSTDDPYFLEFAAQGQNLFQAAGDDGAWGRGSLIYPADNVYVTSVGGTDLTTTGAGGAWSSETAWAHGGGGVSPDRYAIPSWQTTAAQGCSTCSQTYRNGPDVSANANFTFYVCANQTACTANEYGGTSFAAPMWAGFLALVNQQALANGHSPLGFINPIIYQLASGPGYGTAFHDITSGSNGDPATAGYDLATGLGSPNRVGLINALAGAAATTTTLASSVNPSMLGANVTFTATVTGSAPTGGVNFQDNGTSISGCTASAVIGVGNSRTATCATNSLTIGTHSIIASYSGDVGNTSSNSAAVSQLVNAAGSTNFALASNGGVASASSTLNGGYPVTAINNNERTGANWGSGGGWADGTPGTFPVWVQINFNGAKTIDQVVLYTVQDNYTNPIEPTDSLTFAQYGITDFTVQGWDGSSWVTLATVSGNNLVKRTTTFAAFTTDRIRVNVTNALSPYACIIEVEAWGVDANTGSTNVALSSAGAVASASSTLNGGYPVTAINNNERTGANWGSGGGWADGTPGTFPVWVQINFNGAKTIDQVVLYTVQDNYTNPIEPTDSLTFAQYGITDFTVQGWDGSSWVTLATVSGNNLVKRTTTFAAFTTDRIRVNVTNALSPYACIIEVEAWGQ